MPWPAAARRYRSACPRSNAPRSRKTSAASAAARGGRQHVADDEVEVGVGVVPLRPDGVRAQERGHRLDPVRLQRGVEHRQLGVAVEAVARLDLGGGRALVGHPPQVALEHLAQHAVGRRGAGRPDAALDAAAGRVDLLVAGAGRRAARTRPRGRRRRRRGCGSRPARAPRPGRPRRTSPGRRAPAHVLARPGGGDRAVHDGDSGVLGHVQARRGRRRAAAQRLPRASPAGRCCRSGWRRGR